MVDIKFDALRKEYQELLLERNGVIYVRNEDPESRFKGWLDIMGVRVGTYATEDEVYRLMGKLVATDLDLKLLREIAQAYSLRQVLLLEGDPGVGKTFLVEFFRNLIHGESAPRLTLVGSPRISEFDIFGHWAPKGKPERTAELVEQIRNKLVSDSSYQSLNNNYAERLRDLEVKFRHGELSAEDYSLETRRLFTEYSDILRELQQTTSGLSDRGEWEFHQGALLRAYTHNDGRGYILVVDEFGLIPQNYQQIFLQVVGENGRLSEGITFFGNSGQQYYPTGEDTWICLITNYPEKTGGRHTVVPPLVDRVLWRCIPPSQAQAKVMQIIHCAGGLVKPELDQTNLPTELTAATPFPWWSNNELAKIITYVVGNFHKSFVEFYKNQKDCVQVEGSPVRREQSVIEDSPRNALRVYGYLNTYQAVDDEGYIDFARTLETAFKLYYLNRLVDETRRERVQEIIEQIMDGEVFQVEYGEKVLTVRDALRQISRDYHLRGIPQIPSVRSASDGNALPEEVNGLLSRAPESFRPTIEEIVRNIEGLVS